MSDFGRALRARRLAAGLSQERLASLSGLSVRGISDLERGTRTTPRLETIRLLADALGLDPASRSGLLIHARPELAREKVAGFGLPAPLTTLIGRDEIIARVLQQLEDQHVRLLTLVGPGGVGKTRIALAVASSLPDRTVFVELAPVTDPVTVPAALAGALGLRMLGRATIAQTVLAALRDRPLVVVLDNMEHLLAAAPFLSDVLRQSPRVTILATSRSVLRIAGEWTVPIPPLDVPSLEDAAGFAKSPAVHLFTERSGAVCPHFTLSRENAPVVAEICRRLDGLPLAIELAAAKSNLLVPRELLRRLDSRFSILRDGPRDQPARLQSMSDAIGWSVDLLPPEQRKLFARLAVFRGGFSLEAVEAISGNSRVLEQLGAIVDQSLAQVRMETEADTRYGMLETIRESASRLLADSGQEREVRDRHALYFLALAERADDDLRGARQPLWLGRLDLELDNLRAAIDWFEASEQTEELVRIVGALGGFWLFHGHATEGRCRLERALNRAESADVAAAPLAKAQYRLASLLAEQGEYNAAKNLLTRCGELRAALGDRIGLGHVYSSLGAIAEYESDDDQALHHYTGANDIFRATGDNSLVTYSAANLADTAYRRGDLDAARELAIEALETARAAGDAMSIVVALGVVGQAELATRRLPEALAAFDEGLALGLHTGYFSGIANSLAGFAAVACALDRPDLAAGLLASANTVRETAGIQRVLNQRLFEQAYAIARSALGVDRFRQRWDEGALWPVSEATGQARQIAVP